MKTQTTDPRMYPLVGLYDLHTDYFKRALDRIPDDAAQNRLGTQANHIAWIAGSLVQERYELAKLFGADMQQANHDLFSNHKGIQDVKYPPLEDFIRDWNRISPVLRDRLAGLSTEKLDAVFEFMPNEKMTHYELITFMTYREAACIGQIALWRRLLGFPALNYNDK